MTALTLETALPRALQEAQDHARAQGLGHAGGVRPPVAWALVQAGQPCWSMCARPRNASSSARCPAPCTCPGPRARPWTRNPRFARELEARPPRTAARRAVALLLCRSGKRSVPCPAAAQAGFAQVERARRLRGRDRRQQRGNDGWRFHGLPWIQDRKEPRWPVSTLPDLTQNLHAARRERREAHVRTQEPGAREFPCATRFHPDRPAQGSPVSHAPGPARPAPGKRGHSWPTSWTRPHALLGQIRLSCGCPRSTRQRAPTPWRWTSSRRLCRVLAQIRRLLDSDVLAAFHGDPPRAAWTRCCAIRACWP